MGGKTGDPKYFKKAIKWYLKRICIGWVDEELFMSCYEIGNLYVRLGESEKSIYWWLEAYRYRPTKAESLYEIVKYYREKDLWHANCALIFYQVAKKIPYPEGDLLFIKKAVYDYLLDYEYSILAYYLNLPIDHYAYLNLLGKADYNNAIANYKFYTRRLSSLKPIEKEYNQSLIWQNETFHPSTPSLIPFETGYLMNQRYVNYTIDSKPELIIVQLTLLQSIVKSF